MISDSRNEVSPGSLICTLRIIWRTIISKCLSLIFTPCRRYTSCTSLTMYSCTAVGPLIAKMSAGVITPSDNGVPARTASCSCTRICFDSDTRYLRCSPVLEVTTISRLPRFTLPIVTSPSISDTIAGFDGLRASKSSVTRGRPPVISPPLAAARGILTRVSPVLTVWPSSTTTWPPTGKL